MRRIFLAPEYPPLHFCGWRAQLSYERFAAVWLPAQSSFPIHSLRGILKFFPPQHRQPAACAELAENCGAAASAASAGRVDIAGKFNTVRGDASPQSGQATGKLYSASGRKSANVPQREHSYSYFGMPFLVLWPTWRRPRSLNRWKGDVRSVLPRPPLPLIRTTSFVCA